MNTFCLKHWISSLLLLLTLFFIFASAQSRPIPSKKVANQSPSHENETQKAESLYEQGQAAHQRGELERAVALYEQVLKIDSELWQAQYQLALAQFSLQRIPDARQNVIKLIDTLKANVASVPGLKPYLTRTLVMRGEIAIIEKQQTEAATAFQAALEYNPQNARAYSGLAELALLENNPTKAMQMAQSALENGDDSIVTLHIMGVALLRSGKAKDASVYLSKVLEKEPKRADVLRERALAAEQSGDIQKAILDLSASLLLENNLQTKLRLAGLQVRNKYTSEAVATYQQILKDDPENSDARTALAVLLIDSGKGQEAIASLEEILKASPERADIHAQLAELFLPLAPDKALTAYQAAAKLKPEKLSYHLGVATALVKLKRFAEAAVILRQLVAQNLEGEIAYVAHTNLATALFEMDDFANAAREFLWILNQQKDRQRAAVTLYFLGICFDKLGDLEQAQRAYNQFLAVATAENQLEIDKVKLRLPALQRQLEKGQGKRKK